MQTRISVLILVMVIVLFTPETSVVVTEVNEYVLVVAKDLSQFSIAVCKPF